MAPPWPASSHPETVENTGGNDGTFDWVVPGSVLVQVESIVATLNTNAGDGSQPRLTVFDNSGVVIFEKRQTGMIPTGTTDRATWALGLDDDLSWLPLDRCLLDQMTVPSPNGAESFHFTHYAGDVLLDPFVTAEAAILRSGTYAVTVNLLVATASGLTTTGSFEVGARFFSDLDGAGAEPKTARQTYFWDVATSEQQVSVCFVDRVEAGGTSVAVIVSNATGRDLAPLGKIDFQQVG